MKRSRVLASLLPVVTGVILTLWGLKVMYTSFTSGSMPIAGWHTDRKNHFGLSWFIAFFIVLLPAYLYAISLGLQTFRRRNSTSAARPQQSRWATAFGVATLLCLLTFCARVAVTAWFPSPMHPPLDEFQGGLIPGIVATIILLIVEGGVLFAIKHQSQRKRQPTALLIPGLFALLLLVWAGWITFTAFKEGSLPVVGWQTDHSRLFGAAWLVAFFVVLLPAYLYSIGLGLLGVLERTRGDRPTDQNSWLVAIGFTALLGLLTFCTRVAVTSWFDEAMHPPLEQFQGGIASGLITTTVLGAVVVLFHRVARAF